MSLRIVSTLASLALGLALLLAPVAAAQPQNPLLPLVDAAAERLQIADSVAAAKLHDGGLIQDPVREQQVLDAVAEEARTQRIDPAYVTTAFRDQIDATVAVEYARLAGWKLDPATAPADAPDLAASRATIDALNREMVAEMAGQWPALHAPSCRADLSAATDAVAQARGLDDLYRQALGFATRSYCP
ncbi:chorismate mutase [Mycobacterium sp. G7A2]|uniref:chorismate mutase n=1 Tax=Mycobacterium sp. G7A2 TaxID=3317307 RepID=UPI0035A93553